MKIDIKTYNNLVEYLSNKYNISTNIHIKSWKMQSQPDYTAINLQLIIRDNENNLINLPNTIVYILSRNGFSFNQSEQCFEIRKEWIKNLPDWILELKENQNEN